MRDWMHRLRALLAYAVGYVLGATRHSLSRFHRWLVVSLCDHSDILQTEPGQRLYLVCRKCLRETEGWHVK